MQKCKTFPIVALIVAQAVGDPLALLRGDVALLDLLLLVAVRLLVTLLGLGVLVHKVLIRTDT